MRTFPIFAFFLVATILMLHSPTEFTANAAKVSATPIFVDSKSLTSEGAPKALAFNTDGTKMFVVGRGTDHVREYTCDVGFDVSSNCSFVADIELETGNAVTGLEFSIDGTKMFTTDRTHSDAPLSEYACDVSIGFAKITVNVISIIS